MIRAIIFDLDGTLIDSSQDILESLSQAFQKQSLKPEKQLGYLDIGPPISEIIKITASSQNQEIRTEILEAFKELYDNCGFEQTKLYDGVQDLLGWLNMVGIKLFIVTNKRVVPTHRLLEALPLEHICDFICSDSIGGQILPKAELIAELISQWNLVNEETIMVGDSASDIEAAHANGLIGIGFAGGYGDKLSLFKSQPDYVVSKIEMLGELISRLMGGNSK